MVYRSAVSLYPLGLFHLKRCGMDSGGAFSIAAPYRDQNTPEQNNMKVEEREKIQFHNPSTHTIFNGKAFRLLNDTA